MATHTAARKVKTKAKAGVDVRAQMNYLSLTLVIILVSALLASGVQSDFGKVDVTQVRFTAPDGSVMAAKLFRHKAATAEAPLPGVLALHGYQNDKDTAAGGAIELARRGYVVLSIDHLGHGSSQGVMDWTTASGANSGYQYLKSLPFVDAENIGVMGHSMGAMNTLIVGAMNPDHKALNPQCGPAGTADLNNLLLTQAKFEEFGLFREGQLAVEPLKDNPARVEAFGLESGPVDWNTTFGDFADGSARRADLINTVHPGVTHSSVAIAGTVSWFNQALKGGTTDAYWIPENQQIFMWREIFMLVALLAALVSTLFLTNLLLATHYFAPVASPLPGKYTASGLGWWWPAILNAIIAGVTYPLLTQFGGIGGKLKTWLPFLKMEMTNGVALWFLVNALIFLVLFTIWYRLNSKSKGITLYDMGVSFNERKLSLNWNVIGKTALLALILFGWMYALVALAEGALGVEFRFIWPFMRTFEPHRLGYFVVYLIPALLFFLLNGGLFLFGQIRQKEYDSPVKTQLIWWLKNAFTALIGLVIVWAIHYLPYFFGAGPGFELLGLPQFSEMWPLMLFVFIPEFLVILFFVTWFYRRTGKIYLGALMGAILAVWFSVAGTVIA